MPIGSPKCGWTRREFVRGVIVGTASLAIAKDSHLYSVRRWRKRVYFSPYGAVEDVRSGYTRPRLDRGLRNRRKVRAADRCIASAASRITS